MDNNKNEKTSARIFEEAKQITADGKTFWMARQLSKMLDYAEFRNFLPVITKAQEACVASGQAVKAHFVEMHEMVSIGSGAKRKLNNIKLSSYACYLIVQKGDRAKPVLARAQAYFTSSERSLVGQDNVGLVDKKYSNYAR